MISSQMTRTTQPQAVSVYRHFLFLHIFTAGLRYKSRSWLQDTDVIIDAALLSVKQVSDQNSEKSEGKRHPEIVLKGLNSER